MHSNFTMQILWFLEQVEELARPPLPGHLVQASPTACKRFGRHLLRVERIDGTNIHARPLVEQGPALSFHLDQLATIFRAPFDAVDPEAIERLRAYNKLIYGDVASNEKRRRRKAAA